MTKRRFDTYIAVDWSAHSQPTSKKGTANAIWVGIAEPKKPEKDAVKECYFHTRYSCQVFLKNKLKECVYQKRSVLVGFDFGYGYPSGFSKALGLPGNSLDSRLWRLIWDELNRRIEDHENNRNNRFDVANALNEQIGESPPGPFWGCLGKKYDWLLPTKPAGGFPYRVRDFKIEEYRIVERREIRRGIQSSWKTCYPASVGGQSLVGIPVLCQLLDDPELRPFSTVWPYETGFALPPLAATNLATAYPLIVHAEIWPGLVAEDVKRLLKKGPQLIKDQAQVRTTVMWLKALDWNGVLPELFGPPQGLTSEELAICLNEEGWILGVR